MRSLFCAHSVFISPSPATSSGIFEDEDEEDDEDEVPSASFQHLFLKTLIDKKSQALTVLRSSSRFFSRGSIISPWWREFSMKTWPLIFP